MSSRLDAEIKRIKEQAEAPRRKQWEEVKQKAPDMADFMMLMAKTFGKPKAVTVTLKNGDVILNTGAIH